MDTTLLAVLLPAALAFVAGFFVPRTVAGLPAIEEDPEVGTGSAGAVTPGATPQGSEPAEDSVPTEEAVAEASQVPGFAEIAARRGLGWQSAVVAALVAALLGWRIGWEIALLPWAVAVPFLVTLGYIDLRTKWLPNSLMYPFMAVTTVLSFFGIFLAEGGDALVRTVVVAVLVFLFHFVLWFVYPRGLGFGDVRLAWPLGLLLGALGAAPAVAGVWTAWMLGGVGGVLVLAVTKDRKKTFPFGPYLMVGAVVGACWGQTMVDALVR